MPDTILIATPRHQEMTAPIENANPMHPHRPLKVGYALPETELRRGPVVARWTELRAMAERAEAVGVDSLWAVDRLLFPGGDDFVGFTIEETHGGWEVWSLLAKIADTVDEISGGRLILSLGAGDGGGDAPMFGFGDDDRVARFEEAIQIISGLLREGRVDFAGE